MSKTISSFSAIALLTQALAVLLALSMGLALPRGEQLLFSSAHNWQDSEVRIYALDMVRNLAQPMFLSRSDNLPGLPVVVSPDGKRVAYMLDLQPLQTVLLDFQSMRARRLTSSLTDAEFNTEWSPDGRSLAYVGIHDSRSNVYVADADGGNVRLLTTTGAGYKNLVWSPDSSRIAVEVGQLNEDIGVVNVGNGRVTDITRNSERDIRPAWSPDGNEIAFLSSRDNRGTGGTRFDLYMVDAACNPCSPRRLTYTHPADGTWEIIWSPDGQHALLGSTSWTGGNDIFMVDVAAGSAENITHDDATDASPVWSPDNRQFAYESRHDGYWTVVLASVDGGQKREFSGVGYDQRRPIWSPDGRQIAFIANPERNWDIYLMDAADNGAPIRRLTRTVHIEFSPIWRPF